MFVEPLLRKAGYETVIAEHAATGAPNRSPPESSSMKDDITAIRQTVEKHVDQGRDVVMVLHSSGGFLGSEAIEILSKSSRAMAGKAGPRMWIGDQSLLWNNVESDAEVKRLNDMMQPECWNDWDGTTNYCGWREVSSSYLICENDKLISVDWQQQMAQLAESKMTGRCDGGHMSPMTQPQAVADFIQKAIETCCDV
ncbi:MAG: hypothetical protein Q9159_005815 [Coniocarpon cinnabarinum]